MDDCICLLELSPEPVCKPEGCAAGSGGSSSPHSIWFPKLPLIHTASGVCPVSLRLHSCAQRGHIHFYSPQPDDTALIISRLSAVVHSLRPFFGSMHGVSLARTCRCASTHAAGKPAVPRICCASQFSCVQKDRRGHALVVKGVQCSVESSGIRKQHRRLFSGDICKQHSAKVIRAGHGS